jgi:hypothetical protein
VCMTYLGGGFHEIIANGGGEDVLYGLTRSFERFDVTRGSEVHFTSKILDLDGFNQSFGEESASGEKMRW